MQNLRRHLLVLGLASTAALAGCGRAEHAGLPPDVRRELQAGRQAMSSWIAADRSGAALTDEAVIGLGYAERLRLGLGSPFRLVEYALRDPRLSDSMRHDVAWGLLARTLAGEAYEVDAVTLDRAGIGTLSNWPGLGRHHLKLIESAISESRDPRSGELAVRLAYRLASMEGSVPAQAPMLATRVAALIRDRELARADVVRLLRSAEAVQGDPLRAIARWRSERWLRVEAPAMTALPEPVEREALELVPRLTESLRTLAPRIGDVRQHRPTSPDVNTPVLTAAAGRRLAEIADSTNMPLVAPVIIATRTYRRELLEQAWLTDEELALREALTVTGTEERFVAQLAQLVRRAPQDAVPSLAAVWAAVALRTYAQQPVWFPGFGGPSNRDLEERFGLAAVRFEDDVPVEWRPYYRSALEQALQDMQRVLPALDLRGMSVRFAAARRAEATLAMHDPRARELILPPGSSAGTIAHEVAHDLDWQVALRRYRVRGDYASDRASRNGTNDRLAARVRTLAQDAAIDAGGGNHAHAQRPAENFARAIDWFVASTLAAQGRTNGFLSSIQDDILTGYGTVRPPDISGRAGDAIINILDDIAPLYPETRDVFLKSYGTLRNQNTVDLVRTLYELELPQPPAYAGGLAAAAAPQLSAAFAAIQDGRNRALSAVDEWVCRAPGGAREAHLERARRALVVEAAAARARGLALDHARRMAGDDGARWVARQLYRGLWPAVELDEAMQELLAELVREARDVSFIDVQRPALSFELLTQPGHCSIFALRTEPASDAVHVRAPDQLVQLDLVADRQPVVQHPLREFAEVHALPYR
jgi:hypothetical protein